MRRWLLPVWFAVGIGILGGCAKKALIPVAPDNPDAYRKAKTIFVILKSGESYEMKDFAVRRDSLAGTRIFRDERGVQHDERQAAVALDAVSTIQVEKGTVRSFEFFGLGFALGLGVAAALVAAFILLMTSGT